MDLEELRRKRIKLFDSQSFSTDGSPLMPSNLYSNAVENSLTATGPVAPSGSYVAPKSVVASWQKVAQEESLRNELDAFVQPPFVNNPTTVQDENYARELQEAFQRANDAIVGTPAEVNVAEDARLTRELQADFEEELEVTSPSTITPSTSYRRSSKKSKHATTPEKTPIMAEEVDRSHDSIAVRQFASSFIKVTCGICGNHHNLDQDHNKLVELFAASFLESNDNLFNLLFECSACGGKTCFGCGTAITSTSVSYSHTTSNGTHLTWHCDRGRLALMWFLLCGFDAKASHNKPHHVVRPTEPQEEAATSCLETQDTCAGMPHSYSKRKDSRLAGIGYSSDNGDYDYDDDAEFDYEQDVEEYKGINIPEESSVGFPLPFMGKNSGSAKGQKKPKDLVVVEDDDGLTTKVISALTALLPSTTAQLVPTDFDHKPLPAIISLLCRSSILDKAAEMLHNDFLEDVVRRSDAYNALFDFIRALASSGSEVTTHTLFSPRHVNKAGHNLLKVSYDVPTRVRDEESDTSIPLLECMKNLASQSGDMLASGYTSQEVFQEEEELLIMCTNVTDCADFVQKNTPNHIAKAQSTSAKTVDRDAWKKDINVLPIEDDVLLSQHYFAQDAHTGTTSTTAPHRRLARIFKELVNMKTSLPNGIFIRHGESRPDIMKIVIIGPKDTPYENGMFEFDLLCGLEYPNEPPKMQFKTTGGGRVGFNPNLYADGKVCLSLLGTWEGETWKPGKSTLLQVFVSIQAMIFNDEPWCNEPDREGDRGSEQSKHHNRYLHPNVVKYGMVEWLEGRRSVVSPKKKHGGRRLDDAGDDSTGAFGTGEEAEKLQGLWADVSKKHFEVAEADIIKTVCNWVNDRETASSSSGKRKKNTKKAPSFLGTGWSGRTLGESSNNTSNATPVTDLKPANLDPYKNLAEKLKGALEEMDKSVRSEGWSFESGIDEDDEK